MAITFSSLGNPIQNGNLLIVDGLNVAFRWKHSRQLEYKHDYVRTVESLAKSYNCGNIIILADGGSTYRKNIYPDYKANRKDKYAEQTEQEKAEFEQFMGEVSNAFTQLKSRGHLTVRQNGLEADDLAAWTYRCVLGLLALHHANPDAWEPRSLGATNSALKRLRFLYGLPAP